MTRKLLILVALAGLSACGDDPGTRALSGGAIGAAGGAGIAAIAGGNAGVGALIGAGAGAVTGAATTPRPY